MNASTWTGWSRLGRASARLADWLASVVIHGGRRPVLVGLPAVVMDPGPVTGSEDVGLLASASGAPCVFWLLGGADPMQFAGATTAAEIAAVVATLPSNHSPLYAPVLEPTLSLGVAALVASARAWLPRVPDQARALPHGR